MCETETGAEGDEIEAAVSLCLLVGPVVVVVVVVEDVRKSGTEGRGRERERERLSDEENLFKEAPRPAVCGSSRCSNSCTRLI